ncbi:MAG: amidohydrolase family protein [Streptosporangiaceae bacterium]|jgi:imidazolonepropionase-like amidohydrolase
MTRFALLNARVIDGESSSAREGTSILVDGDRIAAVGSAGGFPDDVVRIDATGKTVLPGLIDAHIHLATWGQNLLENRGSTIPYLVARTVSSMREVLNAGCTGVRDCGGLDAGLRDAVADGLIDGPRIATSVTIISPTDGLIDPVTTQGIASPTLSSIPSPVCDGPEAVRAKVREVIRAGADFIKIATSGGVSSPRVHPRRQLFDRDEVLAAVDEAHTAGVRVACHAIGGPGLLMAIEAGVDSVEHGALLDDQCIEAMATRGTWLVPTLAVYRWHETLGTESRRARALELREPHRAGLRRAREAGVPIAAGSDAGGYCLDFSLELELLVEAGFTPMEALRAGTLGSASVIGWQDETGSLAPGKLADLLVVDGDPASDITAIRSPSNIEAVFRNGALVAGSATGRYEVVH